MPPWARKVARKLLRQCTGRSRTLPGAGAMYKQQGGAGKDGRNVQSTLSSSTMMPLRCLLLRGNNLTDAGALALVPLVEASGSLAAIDLRGNRIGTKGELALKKVMRCGFRGELQRTSNELRNTSHVQKSSGIRVIEQHTLQEIPCMLCRQGIWF